MKSALILLLACWATFSQAFVTGRRNDKPFACHHPMIVRGGADAENPAGELVATLAKLDRQWIVQQKAQGPKSRWTKLLLPIDSAPDEQAPGSTTTSQDSQDFVYLLEPLTSTIPSCLIVFLGGAGLGQFPHIAYSEFLMRLSTKLNAAILTAPYQVGLDHFSIAKKSGELLRRAVLYCEDDPKRQFPATIPTYCLGHSLGCKLQTIYMGATGQDYEGIGFLAFNNFGFVQTIRMAREFATQIRNSSGGGSASEMLNSIFNVAEMAIGTLGVEFTPTPEDTDRIISVKYDKADKTRLFVFDDDTLDSSRGFLAACSTKPTVSALPGSHLTPVFFKLGLDDLDLPQEARDIAAGAIGGVESASFGNEQELDALVEEVSSFILGKGPTREPNWTVGGQPRLFESAKDTQ